MWPHVGHLIKGSCLGTSYTKLAPCLVWYRYIWDMYFICHETPHDHSDEMSCIYMGESSLQHVTTMKSLVSQAFWQLRGKMVHQKQKFYKHVLPLKNWVDWMTTRQEKNITSLKMYILRRSVQKFLKNIFSLMTTFYNFT